MARLAPSIETLKRLFARSGNRCAFPGCTHSLFNSDDAFIAEVCHIEAAEDGGERYNSSQTDEQRRDLGNLLAMCHAHHKVTDDIRIYTVERLREIKAEHENKYSTTPFVVTDVTLEIIIAGLKSGIAPIVEAAVKPIHDAIKQVAQDVERLNKRTGIEVTFTNEASESEKEGLRVKIHRDMLNSEAAILAALAIGGTDVRNADNLIKRIVQNPELWKRLEQSRANFEEEQVDSTISETVDRFQRTGPTAEAIKELDTLFEQCWKKEQWASVVKIGNLLLSSTYNQFPYLELVKRVAEKMYICSSGHENFKWAVPLARAYQASNNYLIYARRVYELKADLDVYRLAPVKAPLFNLFRENEEALGFFKLADLYIGEAVQLAFNLGHKETIINVLFNLAFIQYNCFFLVQHLLGQDASEVRDRLFRVNGVLVQLAEKFDLPRDKAIAESNMASVFNMLGEYEKAELISMNAARKLTELGFSFDASRAFRINESARRREKPTPTLSEIKMPEFTAEQVVNMIRTTSSNQLRLQGLSLEQKPDIKEAIEGAYKDLNPERVMQYCKHIDVRYQTSPLGMSILLPSLGIKLIRCEHFRKGVGAVDLDHGFKSFQERLGCERCTFRSHRSDWKLNLDKLDEMCGPPPDAK